MKKGELYDGRSESLCMMFGSRVCFDVCTWYGCFTDGSCMKSPHVLIVPLSWFLYLTISNNESSSCGTDPTLAGPARLRGVYSGRDASAGTRTHLRCLLVTASHSHIDRASAATKSALPSSLSKRPRSPAAHERGPARQRHGKSGHRSESSPLRRAPPPRSVGSAGPCDYNKQRLAQPLTPATATSSQCRPATSSDSSCTANTPSHAQSPPRRTCHTPGVRSSGTRSPARRRRRCRGRSVRCRSCSRRRSRARRMWRRSLRN